MKKFIALAAVAAIAAACTHTASKEDVSKTSKAAAEVGASHYATVSFEKGSSRLTEVSQVKLREIASKARPESKVEEVTIVAWADREYPVDGAKATRADVALADGRAEAVEKYLKDDLKANVDFERHNMAKRPGALAEVFKTDDYELKKTLEDAGAAPTSSVGAVNKSSTALVLVRYEK